MEDRLKPVEDRPAGLPKWASSLISAIGACLATASIGAAFVTRDATRDNTARITVLERTQQESIAENRAQAARADQDGRAVSQRLDTMNAQLSSISTDIQALRREQSIRIEDARSRRDGR